MIVYEKAANDVGRPLKDPGGEKLDQRRQIVCGESWVRLVDEYCKEQPGRALTFSEAVRELVVWAIAEKGRRNGRR